MKIFKGKVTDVSYLNNPEGTWQNARNILLTKKFNSPVNEAGTKFNHLVRGEIKGVIDTNEHIIYFSKLLEGTSDRIGLVSLYDYNKKTLVEVITGVLDFNRPIEGIYKYDYKGDLIVVWCDGVFSDSNTMKIAQLTIDGQPNIQGIDSTTIEKLQLFPNINKGKISVDTSDGFIDGVYAYVTFKYANKEVETNFKELNTYAVLKERELNSTTISSKGLKISLSDLNFELYTSIKLGIYIVVENSNNSYITKNINISSSTLEYNITSLEELISISNEDLLIPKERFNAGETITEHKNSILIGKVRKNPEFKFQKYANLLTLAPNTIGQSSASSGNFITVDLKKPILCYSEIYAFYIQCELTNGDTTSWFHIPNTDITSDDIQDAFNTTTESKYELTLNRFNQNQGYKKFHFENRGSSLEFGAWQNKEIYPNDDNYNSTVDYDGSPLGGKDLRNTPVSYHRIMDEDVRLDNHTTDLDKSWVVNGLKINNFNSIPLAVRQQIKNIRIGFAKRTIGNSLIVTNGVMVPCSTYFSPTNNPDYINQLIKNKIPFTPYFYTFSEDFYDEFTFNKAYLYSPDLEKIKPSIDFNVTLVKGYGKLNDMDTDVDGDSNALRERLNKNKYYFNKDFSEYKLPNNSEQGSQYIDGGFFISYVVDFVKDNTSFLINETINPNGGDQTIADNRKLITTSSNESGGSTFFPNAFLRYAHVALLSFKDNLYNLSADTVVSSLNTIELINNNISSNNVFELGDTYFSEIIGNIKYRTRESEGPFVGNVVRYNTQKLSYKTLSSFNQSYLEFKTAAEPKAVEETVFAGDTADQEILNSLPYGFNVDFPLQLSSLNDLASFKAFNFEDNYIELFEQRIIRSQITPTEGFLINALRTFFANNYYDVGYNKGDIVALRSNDKDLYIQLRFDLQYAEVKDVITTQDTDAFLQTRDIFDREPVSITLEPKGYIGSEHKFACKITKEGYITIDHRQGTIILATPKVKLLSSIGLRNELYNSLEFENSYFEEVNNRLVPIDNPYSFIGFSIGYDYEFNRIFINKLYPEINVSTNDMVDANRYFTLLAGLSTPSTKTFIKKPNNNSFALSFYLDSNYWVCNHDLIASKYIEFKKELLAIKNIQYQGEVYNYGVSHIVNRGFKGTYFGIKYESYLDIIFNKNSETTKTYDVLEIISEVSKNTQVREITNEGKTIDKIIIFNDYQCSNFIELNTDDFDVLRNAEGTWRVNNFRDVLKSPNLPILNVKGDIIETNLNINKEWFDKSYFISKFIVVRLIWNNDSDDSVFVNGVNMMSRISKR